MRAYCPVCSSDKYICWDSDEDFEDLGIEGKGIASFFHCIKCGTSIECYIPEEAYKKEDKKGELNERSV